MAKTRTEEPARSGWREIEGTILITLGLLLLLGILSYKPEQISTFTSTPSGGSNWVGLFGAYMAYLVFIFFGIAGYVIPLCILWIGTSTIIHSERKLFPRLLWLLLGLLSLASLVQMNDQFWHDLSIKLNIGGIPGGVVGDVLAGQYRDPFHVQSSLVTVLGYVGAGIVFTTLFCFSAVRMFDLRVVALARQLWAWARKIKLEKPAVEEVFENKQEKAKPRPARKRPRRKPKPEPLDTEEAAELPQVDIRKMVEAQQKESGKSAKTKPAAAPKPSKKTKEAAVDKDAEATGFAAVDAGGHDDYKLPPLSLLDPSQPQGKGMSADEIANTAEVLQNALEEFGVEAKVTGVQQGPVVTCYEILPASGVRVERIKALADNLALKMHAESIRIQAPIPGKGVCGVEIPNTSRASVFFRELVESSPFQSGKHALPLLLGKDVNGKSIMYDLTKMPHLLIAGATGAGKSVCMNSILNGLLMKHTPDDLRLILVDPKTVEFHAYNNLPHLVVPVITNAKKVALGLKWAIDEMERRFKWFNQSGVRDLPTFNARIIQKQTELFGEDAPEAQEQESRKKEIPEKLPYIVIIIDELADLMHVAQAEIEAGIARLAAKSRAAGIHMILATQRPDVKVITGTIKANFPVRIAFKVSQKVDSRTILDRMGADTLLGKGDMLVLPPGTDKLIRLQGVFTSDDEISRITNFCKEQSQPEFITEIHEKIENKNVDLPDMDSGEDDDIVEQAIEVIRQTKRASTSSLQRRLRIGYTRAARVMDLLEERGIVGPPDGAGPREILIDLDGEIPQNTGAVQDGTS